MMTRREARFPSIVCNASAKAQLIQNVKLLERAVLKNLIPVASAFLRRGIPIFPILISMFQRTMAKSLALKNPLSKWHHPIEDKCTYMQIACYRLHTVFALYQNSPASASSCERDFSLRALIIVTLCSAHSISLLFSNMSFIILAATGPHEPFSISPIFLF